VVAKGLLSKVVEPAGLNVALNLTIPRCPVKLQKPGAELRELVGGEHLDILFNPLDFIHNLHRETRIQVRNSLRAESHAWAGWRSGLPFRRLSLGNASMVFPALCSAIRSS